MEGWEDTGATTDEIDTGQVWRLEKKHLGQGWANEYHERQVQGGVEEHTQKMPQQQIKLS